MDRYLESEYLSAPAIEGMVAAGAKGGLNADGSQRDGFFQYDGLRISGVYDIDRAVYDPVAEIAARVDPRLGAFCAPDISWKALRGQANIESRIQQHFDSLSTNPSQGSALARQFAGASRRIAQALVADGVASSAADVDTVVVNGFHHLYGPLAECTESFAQG